MATTRFKYVLFDLDQTLCDRGEATRTLAGRLFDSEATYPESINRITAIDEFIRLDKNGYQSDKIELFTELEISWGGLRRTPANLAEWLATAPRDWYSPDPEIVSFVRNLTERGVTWGIVTNGSAVQRDKGTRLGVIEDASCFVISEVVGFAKPDPAIFALALQEIGNPAPSDVLFVGDNPVADIEGSKAAGMATAWIQNETEWPTGFELPDHILKSVLECDNLLG